MRCDIPYDMPACVCLTPQRTGESTEARESEIQHFLDTFFLSRIAIRFLAGHHISMFDPPRSEHIGLVHTKCSPFQVGGHVYV